MGEIGFNFLVKFVGALITSIGFVWMESMMQVNQSLNSSSGVLVVGLLTIGLMILFAPEIKKK